MSLLESDELVCYVEMKLLDHKPLKDWFYPVLFSAAFTGDSKELVRLVHYYCSCVRILSNDASPAFYFLVSFCSINTLLLSLLISITRESLMA